MGESFQKLNLTNAYLFAAALQDEEICRNLLEIVLNKEIPRVKAHAEHTLFLDSDFKSVRFDVYASDEDEVSYDVEMQNDDARNLPKRSRYYQGEMDVTFLKPGEDYNQLKPSYIIFICSFDPFGEGRYQYVFEEYCRDAGILLGDETQKIFFNTNGTDQENITPELLHLFAYLKQSTEEVAEMHPDEKIRNIHERVKYLKRDRKLEAGYMTMEEYIREEAERRAKLMAPSIAESMAETFAKPMAETLAKPMAESMAETLAKPMAETLAKPMAESMAESLAASKVAQSILSLVAELGTIPAEEQQRIAGEQDDETLEKWLKLAARSTTVEEFLSGM